MIRVEIFANQSMEDLLLNNLEAAIPDFYYSVVPLSHGRGGETRKLGTTTWPETNVIIISYCDDGVLAKIETVVNYIKEKHKAEGIKLFVLHDR